MNKQFHLKNIQDHRLHHPMGLFRTIHYQTHHQDIPQENNKPHPHNWETLLYMNPLLPILESESARELNQNLYTHTNYHNSFLSEHCKLYP